MKISFAAVLFLAGLPLTAQAGPREDARANIARCDQVTDDHAWLDCVYGAVQPMRTHLGLLSAPESQTRLVPPAIPGAAPPMPAPEATQNSGLLANLVGGNDVAGRQHMMAYSFDRAGLFTVTLADGTAWQQLPSDGIRAGWRGNAAGYVVTVSQGALGSNSLTVAGTGVNYRVKRIR